MAWNKVDAGEIGSESYLIERRVFDLPVPGTAARHLIQLRSYRWKLTGSDGRVSKQGTAKTRASARDQVRSNADQATWREMR